MSDHAKDEEYVTELLARLTAARKARTEAELVAANQASELATIAAALGDHRMSHVQVIDKIRFMSARVADLDRLQAAARDVLAEPEADDKRLIEGLGTAAWLLRFLVQDSPQPRGLLQAAKDVAKLQKDQQNKTVELLQAMVPYFVEDKPSAALEAWRAAGRRSALFQKTGQELGLTDSASPEQILQRAQEVAMILRSRSQAQDFDANLLAMLGLPANTSRDAVLDAVKGLVAFRDGRASAIKNAPSDDSTRDLALLQDKIAYELGLLSPQLPDCREGLGKAGSLLRLLAQPDRSAALVDLAHAKVKEMTRPRHPGSSFAKVHPALFGDLLMTLDLPIGTSAEELVAAVKTLAAQRQNPANKST